jgi:hypothetical protein
MIWRLLKLPRDVAQALIRTLFAPREGQGSERRPRLRLVVPDMKTTFDAAEEPQVIPLSDLLDVLREGGSYRTADELAAALRRRGMTVATTMAVREALKHEAARHVEVRLRDEPGGKVAEFRARPTA